MKIKTSRIKQNQRQSFHRNDVAERQQRRAAQRSDFEFVMDETWSEFERIYPELPLGHMQAVATHAGITLESLLETMRAETAHSEFWQNNLYLVEVNQNPDRPMIYISIRRLDRAPVHDWRHFQRIKNELIGAEFEAVELYPAESRLHDSANQYHLWALKDGHRFSFGFDGRAVWNGNVGVAKQRPYSEKKS